ncbi:MAG: DUF177 domain-containing protein [Bacilli bacterium]|nr:DUF177 domain-containing protein [Bacilli bacterium]
MKFNKSALAPREIKELEEVVSFTEVKKPLLALDNIYVKATIFKDNNLINVSLKIKGVAKVECAYTLESVDYPLDFTDSIDISEDENNLDAYFIKDNLVDLNSIILESIKGEIPTRVIKKGAKLHVEGDGYRVLSEDDLKKDKKEEYNPAFDKLKDLDL